jgi:hypothetical protein
MSMFLRPAAVVLCLGVLALGVVAFDPACLPTYPPPGDPNLRSSMAEEVVRRERLKQLEDASFRRTEAKRQVAAEVIAGRRRLAEAIEQFRTLDRQWPELSTWIKKPEELLMSPDEWGGREVLRFIRLVLADRPDEAAAVAGRLEKELQELLADRKKRRPAPAAGSR